MPLLKVPCSRRGCDVQKFSASVVFKHQVRDEHFQRHSTCSQIHIEISIIVDIAKVTAHRHHVPIKANLDSDVMETLGTNVSIESRSTALFEGDLQGECNEFCKGTRIVVNVKIELTIVVIVPEPAGETV